MKNFKFIISLLGIKYNSKIILIKLLIIFLLLIQVNINICIGQESLNKEISGYNHSINTIYKNSVKSKKIGELQIANFNGNLMYEIPISTHRIDGNAINVNLKYCSNVSISSFDIESYLSVNESWCANQSLKENLPLWIISVNGIAIQVLYTRFGKDQRNTSYVYDRNSDLTINYNSGHWSSGKGQSWMIDGYDFDNRIYVGYNSTEETNITKDQDIIKILSSDGSIIELRNPLCLDEYSNGYENPGFNTGTYYEEGVNKKGFAQVEYDDTFWTEYYRNIDVTWCGGIGGKVGSSEWGQCRPRIIKYYPGDGLEYVFKEIPLVQGSYWFKTLYLEEIRNCNGTLTYFKRSRNNNPNNLEEEQGLGRALVVEFSGHKLTYSDDFMYIEALGKTYKLEWDKYPINNLFPELKNTGIEQNYEDLPSISNEVWKLDYWKNNSKVIGIASLGYQTARAYLYPDNLESGVPYNMVYLIKSIIGPDLDLKYYFEYDKSFKIYHTNGHSYIDGYRQIQYRMSSLVNWELGEKYEIKYKQGLWPDGDNQNHIYLRILAPQPDGELRGDLQNMVSEILRKDFQENLLSETSYTYNFSDGDTENEYGYNAGTHETLVRRTIRTGVGYSKIIEAFGFGFTKIPRFKNNLFDLWQREDFAPGHTYTRQAYPDIYELRQDYYWSYDTYVNLGEPTPDSYAITTKTFYPPPPSSSTSNRFIYLPTKSITTESQSFSSFDEINSTITKYEYSFTPTSSPSRKYYDYNHNEIVDLTNAYGMDIIKKTSLLCNSEEQCILKNVEEYKSLPLTTATIQSSKTDNKYLWDRINSQMITNDIRLAGVEATSNVWQPKTWHPGDIVTIPPIFGLTTKSYITDPNNNILKGEEIEYYAGVLNQTMQYEFKPGVVMNTKLLGKSGNSLTNTIYHYNTSGETWPSKNNLLSSTENIIGCKDMLYYDYNIPSLKNGIMNYYNDPYGIMSYTGNVFPDGTPKKLFDIFPIFEQPLALEKNVRKWTLQNNIPVLKTTKITELLERSYWGTTFGEIKGVVDPNGYYSHYCYDYSGRLIKAWLPLDFSKDDIQFYNGIKKIKLYGKSETTTETIHKECPSNIQITQQSIVSSNDMVVEKMTNYYYEPQCPYDDMPIFDYDRYTSSSYLTYKPNLNDPIHNNVSINSAKLRFVVSSLLGQCVELRITFDMNTGDPEDNETRFYTLNCDAIKVSDPGIISGGLQNWNGKFPIYNELELDQELINKLQGDNDVTIKISTRYQENSEYNFGTVRICNDADGARPELSIDGVFPEQPEFNPEYPVLNSDNNYTIACQYNNSLINIMNSKIKFDDKAYTADDLIDKARSIEYSVLFGVGGNPLRKNRNNRDLSSGIGTLFEYNGMGNQIKMTDELGIQTQFEYNMSGQPTKAKFPDNTETKTQYRTISANLDFGSSIDLNTIFQNESFETTLDLSDQVFFNNICNIELMTSEDGKQNHMKITDYFNNIRRGILFHKNANSNISFAVTKYDYDLVGNLLKVTNPKGQIIEYTYDDFYRKKTVIHPDFGSIRYQYDNLGNIRFIQNQEQKNNNLFQFNEYDDLGRIVVVGEAKLSSTEANMLFNLNEYPNALQNGLGSDAINNPLTANKTLLITPVKSIPSFWTTLTYSNSACLSNFNYYFNECIPANQNLLKHASSNYLKVALPMSDYFNFENFSTFPENLLVANSYDELPLKLGAAWINFPDIATWNKLAPKGIVRNLRNNLAAVAYREHGYQPFHYTVFSYDERGRLEVIIHYNENLGFDAVYYSYNSMDLLTSVRTVDPKRQYTTWYGYDANGRLDKVWSKLSDEGNGIYGNSSTYTNIDLRFPPAQARPFEPDITYTYTVRDQIASCKYHTSENLETKYTYNERKWLTSIESGRVGKILFNQNNTYSSTGLITNINTIRDGQIPINQTFSYNELNMLKNWTYADPNNIQLRTENYTYDFIGNRLNVNGNANKNDPAWNYSRNYSYPVQNNNKLEQISDNNNKFTSYMSYNSNGAMNQRFENSKSSEIWDNKLENFEYNIAGQLETYMMKNIFSTNNMTQAEFQTNTQNIPETIWKYRYSVNGEREQKRLYSDKATDMEQDYPWVYYLLGSGSKQLAVYNGLQTSQCNNLSEVFFYPSEYLTYGAEGFSNIITKFDGTKVFSIGDHLGSVRARFNQDGEIIANYDYEPFGAVIGKSKQERLQYIDKEKDTESELNDYGARKYDEDLGRFTTIDPLWEKYYGLSPSVYSANNPISLLDPSGTEYYVNDYGFLLNWKPLDANNQTVFRRLVQIIIGL